MHHHGLLIKTEIYVGAGNSVLTQPQLIVGQLGPQTELVIISVFLNI